MALNKLENQIKEKLSSREIQPSSQAWDRLGAMLTVAEEKKTKRFSFFSFPFIGIAATITILLLAGLVFLSQKSTKIDPQNNIVTTDVKKDSIKKLNNLNLPIQTPIVEKDKEDRKSTRLNSSHVD